MSIIQNIRDKYAKVAVIAIALALIGFILTDYFSGRGRNLFRGNNSSGVGSVNGKSISYADFKLRVDGKAAEIENMYRQRGMQPPPASMLQKDALESAWNDETSIMLLKEEYNRIGMKIGKKERGDIIFGATASEEIRKLGTDERTGVYDPLTAQRELNRRMKDNSVAPDWKQNVNDYISGVDDRRLGEKYNSLFVNSNNYPRWFVEKMDNDNAQVGKISFVRMAYTDSTLAADSTIKISDKEIEDYISKHKDKFKQTRSRNISFVSFSAAPTVADSGDTKKQLAEMRAEFDTAQGISSFFGRDVTAEAPDIFLTDDLLPPAGKDSIMKLSKNAVIGPYLETGAYVMVKLVDTKVLPDSIKCRHIIVSTDVQNGGFEDSTASHKIDSIMNAIQKTGASWEAMAKMYNSDGTKDTKGEMTFSTSTIQSGMQSGGFAKEFGQFILWDGKPGQTKKVKTSFGWHYIEIMSFIKPETQYKIAYLAKDILPSRETEDNAIALANTFFGDSKDQKTFDAAFEKVAKPGGGVKGVSIDGIGPLDNDIRNSLNMSLSSRSFVNEIYKAKLGQVIKLENKIGDNLIVAIITEVNEEGTMSVAKARPSIEAILRQKKKAEMIKQKIGTITTLEDAAAKLGKPIETIDSLRMTLRMQSKIGNEPAVMGATFNPANKGKVVTAAIEGNFGVYVVRVESTGATASLEGPVEEQRKIKYQNSRQQGFGPLEGLKKVANIKDKRSEKF